MALLKSEVEQWLRTIPEDDEIFIDEGGLCLESTSEAYLEVGGKTDDTQ